MDLKNLLRANLKNFAAYVPGYGQEVARGGRYDDIGKDFGRARPATGFSSDLKVLIDLGTMPQHERNSIYAPADDDPGLLQTIAQLRSEGESVVRQLPGQHGGAQDMGCARQLVRANGGWQVKSI